MLARMLLVLIALPFSLVTVSSGLMFIGADPMPGWFVLLGAVAFFVLVVFGLAREQTARLWLGDEGVELRWLTWRGLQRTELRFAEVDEVFLEVQSQNDGLLGVVLEAATKPEHGVNESTNYVRIRVRGAGREIAVTNGFKGVFGVYVAAVVASRERLRASALAALGRHEEVRFGPFTITRDGVRYGRTSIAWADVAGLEAKRGRLRLDKRGAWLSRGNPLVSRVPNVEVLVSIVEELRMSAFRGATRAGAGAVTR